MKYLQLIFFCFTITTVFGQADTSFHLLRVIKGDIVDFTVDNLNNTYIINSKNQLKKINADGDSMAVFNDVKKFGQLSYIDVSNPLKPLIYYRDFATIVVLDRFLNIRNTIDLRKQNIFSVKAIGQSYDNKIWLYDEQDNKLKKIDEDGKVSFRKANGNRVSPVIPFHPRQFFSTYYPVHHKAISYYHRTGLWP